ncbi:MAG: hypothetical protein LQ351_007551 [Letrouitia transgressa]|nr:MAG: hypothetical protein LQ351_007551 [Letrouitia transgressa]
MASSTSRTSSSSSMDIVDLVESDISSDKSDPSDTGNNDSDEGDNSSDASPNRSNKSSKSSNSKSASSPNVDTHLDSTNGNGDRKDSAALLELLEKFFDRIAAATQPLESRFCLSNLSKFVCNSNPVAEWLASNRNNDPFCLQIPAGIDSSLLMRPLVEGFESKDTKERPLSVVVANIQFSLSARESVATSVFATVSHQILAHWGGELETEIYDDLLSSLRGRNQSWIATVLWRLLRLLLVSFPRTPLLVVVLFLDEKSSSFADEILTLRKFTDFIQNLSKAMKIFIVTPSDICSDMGQSVGLRLDLDDLNFREELSVDLRSWVTDVLEERPLIQRNNDCDILKIADCYQDALLLASYLHYLATHARITEKRIRKLQDTLHQPENLFIEILKGINETERSFVGTTLAIVNCAARPLTVIELTTALGMMSADISSGSLEENAIMDIQFDIRHSLAGLIVGHGKYVGFAHPAIQSIINQQTKLPRPFEIIVGPQFDAKMARACLRYIDIWTQNFTSDKADNDNTNVDKWPMLDYATRYWLLHYQRASIDHTVNNEIHPYIEKWPLLKSWMKLWSRSHSCVLNIEKPIDELQPTELTKMFSLNLSTAIEVSLLANMILPVVDYNESAAVLWSIGQIGREKVLEAAWSEKLKEPSTRASLLKGLPLAPLDTFFLLRGTTSVFTLAEVEKIFTTGVTQGVPEIVDYCFAFEQFKETPLTEKMWLVCAKYGHIDLMKKFISLQSSLVTSESLRSGTALDETVRNGNLDSLQLLLSYDVNVDAVHDSYGAAIASASKLGLLTFLHSLLKRVASILERYKSPTVPDDLENTELQVAYGAQTTRRDSNNHTPLMFAVRQGDFETTKVLLQAIEDKILQTEIVPDQSASTCTGIVDSHHDWGSILGLAIYTEQDRIAMLFLKHDLCPKVNNDLLLDAARNGCLEVVDYLTTLDSIDINHQDFMQQTALHLAALRGPRPLVDLLLNRSANISIVDAYGDSALDNAIIQNEEGDVVRLFLERQPGKSTLNEALLTAAKRGKPAIAALLLEAGAEVNASDSFGKTSLHWAALNGYDSVVQLLLLRYADLDRQDEGGDTALLLAAQYGRAAVVKLLLDASASIQIVNHRGNSPLLEAALNGQNNVVQLLFQRVGAFQTHLNSNLSADGKSLLEQLVQNDLTDTAKLILDLTNETDSSILAECLHIALRKNNLKMFSLLREKGADPSVVRKDPKTGVFGSALQHCAFDSKLRIAKDILEQPSSISVNQVQGTFHTALIASVCRQEKIPMGRFRTSRKRDQRSLLKRQKMIDYLVEKGASWNISGGMCGTVLGASLMFSSPDLVEYILDHVGVPACLVDHEGRSVSHMLSLDYVHRASKLEVIKKRVDRESMDAADKQGRTPLHFACAWAFMHFVEYLLQDKDTEYANATDNDGWTPLHWACRHGDDNIVQVLLQRGANYEARTISEHWTPWHVAIFHENIESAHMIEHHGFRPEEAATERETSRYNASCDSCYVVS